MSILRIDTGECGKLGFQTFYFSIWTFVEFFLAFHFFPQFFAFSHFDYSVTLAMRRPTSQHDMFAFFKPFTHHVWISIICAFVGTSILLYISNRLHMSHPSCSRRTQLANKYNDSSLLGTFWFVYSAIVQNVNIK